MRGLGTGSEVQGLGAGSGHGVGVWGLGTGSGHGVWGLGAGSDLWGLGAGSGYMVWGAGSGVPGQAALLRGLLLVPATPSSRQTGSHRRPGDSDCQGAFEEQRSFSIYRIPKLLR